MGTQVCSFLVQSSSYISRILDFDGMVSVNIPKIDKQYEPIMTSLTVALIMTFITTFIGISVNFGLTHDFFLRFVRTWVITFSFGFPVVFFVIPRVRRLMNRKSG
jgi:ABC-type glycerol-3-phosphate transport system permease component